MQGAHGLLNRGPGVPTMDLVQVDVVHVEPTQRRVNARQDVLAAQPTAVLAGRHRHEHLGGDHRLVTAEELGNQPPGRHLAGAGGVGVGGVEEGHSAFHGCPDDRLRGLLVDDPGAIALVAESHHAQADSRDSQARRAQIRVVHG